MADAQRIFLLSPAKPGGRRYNLLLRPQAAFDVAVKLRTGNATLGELYAFMSSLYFRGKLAYAAAFASAPQSLPPALVIVPGMGLLAPQTVFDIPRFQGIARVPVDEANHEYRQTLSEAAASLAHAAGDACSFVLLGSVASSKYTGPLLEVFGERLLFPVDFVGRGDMSRGGLMLRAAGSGIELPYIPAAGALRRGIRPPRLEPLQRPRRVIPPA